MIPVLRAEGPGDGDLAEEVPGFPSDKAVIDALRSRREILEKLLLLEEEQRQLAEKAQHGDRDNNETERFDYFL